MDKMVQAAQKWLNKNYEGKIKVDEDGVTGWGTINALTKALQIELGLNPDGLWGPGTLSKCPTINKDSRNKNIIGILQCGLYCKGYDGDEIDGLFTLRTSDGVVKLKKDCGLSDNTSDATPIIFKALLSTMDGFVLARSGDEKIRKIQQNLNRDYNKVIGLIPCNGVYSRETNRALIKALQLEEGVGADGIWGNDTMKLCPTIPGSKSNKRFVLLLQYALYVNGFDPNGFDGLFGVGLSNAIKDFQKFCSLGADGYAGKQVWASLLVSTGDKNRKGTACDCAQSITDERAKSLKNNGYKVVGRYLTGKYKLTYNEMNVIFKNGLRVFPIFEIGGNKNSYFTAKQGMKDAIDAINAAKELKFGDRTIIYFAVDYDAYGSNITENILPYFEAIKNRFDINNQRNYRIGIYAPRHICSIVSTKGYSCSSFVCDMSSGFSGNLGFPLPKDWAFDQITTISVGEGNGRIEIDKDICSGRDLGVDSTQEESDLIYYANRSKINQLLGVKFEHDLLEDTLYCGPLILTYKVSESGTIGSGSSKLIFSKSGVDLEISKDKAAGKFQVIDVEELKNKFLTPMAKSMSMVLYDNGVIAINYSVDSFNPFSFNIEFESITKIKDGSDVRLTHTINIKYNNGDTSRYTTKSNLIVYVLNVAILGMITDQPVDVKNKFGTPVIIKGMEQKWYTDIVNNLINAIEGIDYKQVISVDADGFGINEMVKYIQDNIDKVSDATLEKINTICANAGFNITEFIKNPIVKFATYNIIATIAMVLFIGSLGIGF
ncbi:MAG: glycoside hydrolase domain-containing protein [Clostridium sp.]|uniref:glycoside hydrolase domain-containing protein n=1 Tax=Clostridium sp. LY3-2 TaxID=2942482 RepID=UPI0021534EAE|nr:glycoside hydrolase domain-containing protein [Clostridium sp. LY3-2]MCR6514926.1 DUF1906 domain-containing protein [Clostridium sp. LY3-2]